MELLDKRLTQYHEECEKTVLKYLLKEFWKICIVCMEKMVVLPSGGDKNVSVQSQQQSKSHPLQLLKQLPGAKIGDVKNLAGSIAKGQVNVKGILVST